MDSEKKMVTITEEEYRKLKYDSFKLEIMTKHGVEKWDGYDNAMEDFEWYLVGG